MSTINNTTITHYVTLSNSGNYTSPLTITSTGAVDESGFNIAVYGPDISTTRATARSPLAVSRSPVPAARSVSPMPA
jgi:hypothetical protein